MNLDIPKDFNSDSDDKPFLHCKVCECDLTQEDAQYTIEKAFKRVDENQDITLFEMAICMPCALKQYEKMSEHSRKYMESVLGKPEFQKKRHERWHSEWRETWKNECLYTGKAIQLNDEYHIIGHFQGGKLVPGATPFVLGQELLEEVQENLSLETKEEMDRFRDEFLGPDPKLKELFPEHQFIMM